MQNKKTQLENKINYNSRYHKPINEECLGLAENYKLNHNRLKVL